MFEAIQIGSENQPPDKALVFLHGLGASADDLKSFAADLDFPGRKTCRIVLPQAPVRAVTLAGGMRLAAWFDLFAIEKDAVEDEDGIIRAADSLNALLVTLAEQGIARERVALGGFSQGGALALYQACHSDKPLAGVVALSAYLPLRNACPKATTATPIFMAHGTHDEVLPMSFGEESYAVLERQGFEATWRSYPIGHNLCRDLVVDLTDWLARRFTA